MALKCLLTEVFLEDAFSLQIRQTIVFMNDICLFLGIAEVSK